MQRFTIPTRFGFVGESLLLTSARLAYFTCFSLHSIVNLFQRSPIGPLQQPQGYSFLGIEFSEMNHDNENSPF